MNVYERSAYIVVRALNESAAEAIIEAAQEAVEGIVGVVHLSVEDGELEDVTDEYDDDEEPS